MLTKLKSGDWIDLSTVTAVSFFPMSNSIVYPDEIIPARVSIVVDHDFRYTIRFKSDLAARRYCDKIAKQVNLAKANLETPPVLVPGGSGRPKPGDWIRVD